MCCKVNLVIWYFARLFENAILWERGLATSTLFQKFCKAAACVQRVGVQCEETEAAIKQPIAAPAWTRYGTRPSLRHLCVLPPVRAAGCGFRRRRGALRAGRCTLGRVFGLTDAAQPRTWRYVIAHGMADKVHVTNSWQSSRACPVCMIVALSSIW